MTNYKLTPITRPPQSTGWYNTIQSGRIIRYFYNLVDKEWYFNRRGGRPTRWMKQN